MKNEHNSPTESGAKRFSRRNLFKGLLGIGAGRVAAHPLAQGLSNFSERVDEKAVASQQEQELPSDIVSREELAERFHTRIHDLPESDFPHDFVELNLRRGIEETRLFQMLEQGRLLGMDIFLINSDSVNPAAFTPEQQERMNQYPTLLAGLERERERAREKNRWEIEEHRADMQEEYRLKVQELESQRPSLTEDQYAVRLQALNYTYGRYLREEPLPEDLEELVIRGYSPTLGSTTDEQGRHGPHNFVFLAIRNSPATRTFTSGTETLTISASRLPYQENYAPSSGVVSPDQSYPRPENFTVADDPSALGYVILGGSTPGSDLRHEFQHSRGVIDETGADVGMLEEFAEAAQHMEETGSDEKYWAAFRTPEGVTITRAPTTTEVL